MKIFVEERNLSISYSRGESEKNTIFELVFRMSAERITVIHNRFQDCNYLTLRKQVLLF